MLRRLGLPVALLAFAALAAPAGASTTVGQLAAPTNACPANYLLAEVTSNAPQYTMPTAGVVTALSGQGFGTSVQMDILVLRPAGGTNYTVVGGTGTQTFTAGAGAQSFPVRIPVKAGDILGVWTGPAALQCIYSGAAGDTVEFNTSVPTDPAAGSPVTLPSTAPNIRLSVQGTLEPDADGYGDQTQDSCPADPAIHAGSCARDMSVAQSVFPASTPVGSLLLDTVTVQVADGRASGLYTVVDNLPAGVTLVGGAGTGGPCTGAGAVSCPGASIPPGGTGTVLLVLRTVAAGTFTNVVTVNGQTEDSNPGNNASTAAIVGTPIPSRGDRCVVPRVAGQSLAFARLLLQAAHCRTGKVTKPRPPRRHRGRLRYVVAGSNPRAGTARPAGARVALPLRLARG